MSFSNAPKEKTELIGKSFKALVGETCKDMIDGGCMIYTYEWLTFHQDSVTISYEVKAYCTPVEREKNYTNLYSDLSKNYNWSLKHDTIRIHGNSDFNELIIRDSLIFGFDRTQNRNLIFHEIQN
jgi:hypothetical protein